MSPRLGRYLVEWCLLLLVGIGVGELVREMIGDDNVPELFRPSVIWALLVIGVADPVIYAMVARGLIVKPSAFFNLWGLSVLAKIVWYGVAGAAVAFSGLVTTKVFPLALAAAFPVFTAHQVLNLVRLARHVETKGGPEALT